MDEAIQDILEALKQHETLDAVQLDKIIRKHSKRSHDGRRTFSKKRILSYYINMKGEGGAIWARWKVDDELDARFLRTMQMKPRRTASGVATITVITKPWPCANNCVYCPNDPTMPKSYLRDEPACQRAERNGFDPYLQTASRLHTLQNMGHATDKVELIVLGGTWMDYPRDYRIWFISELFRALNDSDEDRSEALSGLKNEEPQTCNIDRLRLLHRANETAKHRVVGLVVETRPDTITTDSLREMRELGCTKVQMGVQAIDTGLLAKNHRRETPEMIARALDLARLFGFKTHTHFMVNLLGATPETDKRDYERFAIDPDYSPDEVKLYPCALVEGTQLVECYKDGYWTPYTEEQLVDVLCACMKVTPCHMRVSRMIRDISAKDIMVGNKKTNLRQIVDERLRAEDVKVAEIRFREVATDEIDLNALEMRESWYQTRSTQEVFIEWITPEERIAGFLRLSLPGDSAISEYPGLPIRENEAMIREVHVYGVATRVGKDGESAQHRGLGRSLVERACGIARERGYSSVNVISAVGTREYYRKLGFYDNGLYQRRELAGDGL